jgi:hypothetical protein
MQKTTVYFISEAVPANTHASSVVFYRHFKRLEQEGYRIVWVTDNNSYHRFKNQFPTEWDFVLLPNRNWNLPPYRPYGLLQAWRFHYYNFLLSKRIAADQSKSILMTYINGQFLAPFAAYFKRRSKLPLLSFFHDDILELNYFRNRESLVYNTHNILKASEQVLVASNEFAANWPRFKEKFHLLYPLPEKYSATAGTLKQKGPITFGYAGAIYDEIIPCLMTLAEVFKQLGLKLLIVGDRYKTICLQEQYVSTVSCLDMFATPEESNDFLVKNCDGVLIPYPEQLKEMPWIATCFPSKFLQYCQLGLPTIIIAPETSAIGKWSLDNRWPLYSNVYDFQKIAQLSRQLNIEAVCTQINSLKHNEFDPDKIHLQLAGIIKYIISND